MNFTELINQPEGRRLEFKAQFVMTDYSTSTININSNSGLESGLESDLVRNILNALR